MTTNHIKAILTSLRAMIVKMLPAYKFYLGSTTETTTTQIGHGVMSVADGQTQGQGALTIDDMSFAGFVEGETYTVVVNGVSGEYVAVQPGDDVLITNVQDFENPLENYWAVGFVSPRTGEPYILMYSVLGSYANATISISQTKTVTTKKYQTKKLDNSLLPDSVESGIEAANTALARTVEPYTGEEQMTPLYKNGGFSAWRSVVQNLSYDETEGYFSSDRLGTTALNGADMPQGVFCARVYAGNQIATAFLHKANTTGGLWIVAGFAVKESRPGEILYVGSNAILQSKAKGLFLTFMAPDSMLLKSSTSGSDKQFRITVDDAGTLKATEVTDA